jgi:hypothetical protein
MTLWPALQFHNPVVIVTNSRLTTFLPQAPNMSVTIHTTNGDIKAEIFCDTCPRTAFNFLALAAAGKYDRTIFHRNIRGFMMQGGDTAHVTGKKSSIWGNDVTFPDEFHPNNKHDRRGRLVSQSSTTRRIRPYFVHSTQLILQ